MIAGYSYHPLHFIKPGGTSRGILHKKDSWFLYLKHDDRIAIGECSFIEGLNPESKEDIEQSLNLICNFINEGQVLPNIMDYNMPAIRMCLDTLIRSYESAHAFKLFDCDFLKGEGIAINGLVWMGSYDYMYQQLKEKLDTGFKCIKIKIAAIDFEEELNLLDFLRKNFSAEDLEIRLDANGGFEPKEALDKINRLEKYAIHSIEQPVSAGQWEIMNSICNSSPISIALDEELIGIKSKQEKIQLIESIQPQYIILKPSLIGGFQEADEWISQASAAGIKWWATSALESNIGLNAIAQWCSSKNSDMYQGLGTGKLFSNNIESPLYIHNAQLYYGASEWKLARILPVN